MPGSKAGMRETLPPRRFPYFGSFNIACRIGRGKFAGRLRALVARRSAGRRCRLRRSLRHGQIRLDADIDGIAGVVIPAQIVKGHDMRRRRRKGAGQPMFKRGIRRVVRPQCKNTAGMQMRGKPRQPLRLVERGMAWVQQVSRRMVDIHQHRIETTSWLIGVKAGRRNATLRRSRRGPGGNADHLSVADRAEAILDCAIRSLRPRASTTTSERTRGFSSAANAV